MSFVISMRVWLANPTVISSPGHRILMEAQLIRYINFLDDAVTSVHGAQIVCCVM